MKKTPRKANHLLSISERVKDKIGAFRATYQRPLLAVALQSFVILAITALPGLAQGPNPFGGSGTTKLSNAGANIMVIGTWLAFFVGLISFVLIPIFIKFEWDYKKLIMSGLTGVGGFVILGAIAYDIVNLSSTTITDPTIGN